jgi:hypothetical protein
MQAKVDLHWRHEEQAPRKLLYGSLQTFGILAVLLLGVLGLCWMFLVLGA